MAGEGRVGKCEIKLLWELYLPQLFTPFDRQKSKQLPLSKAKGRRRMLRKPMRNTRSRMGMDSMENIWPDDTIVVLPETPRVRVSPRRRMNPQTPGWEWAPTDTIGETIRMYHDPEIPDETVNFTMNHDFIESIPLLKRLIDE